MPASRKRVKTDVPGIYTRGNRYVIVWYDHQGHQRSSYAKTKQEAKDIKAARRTDVRRGEYRETSRETFATYAPRWVDTYRGRTSRGVKARTIADYRSYLERYAIPYFGRFRLAEITPQDIKSFAAAVAQGTIEGRVPHKKSGVRAILAPLKALFATAFEDGLIRSNPAAGVRIFVAQTLEEKDEAAEAKKPLSAAELSALLTHIPEPWRLFFRFLADTGVRIGEAIELRWKDVDLGTGKVQIRRQFYCGDVDTPKSRFGVRTVRLTPDVSRALWTLRDGAGDDALVFTAERGGRIDQSNLMSRVLKPAAVAAGLGLWTRSPKGALIADTWVGFHTFRHTCATTLFREGWNAVQVQRWLGHHKPSFTLDTYIHFLEDDTPEAIDVSGGAHTGPTRAGEIGRNAEALEAVELAV